jgi:hypothetical protein
MTFESRVLNGLSGLLDDYQTAIVVDSVHAVPGGEGKVLSVAFHLEGDWTSPVGFVFRFVESEPLEDTLADVRESISNSWNFAHLPPSIIASQDIGGN